ncbi:MAG: enolase C-terminal domain-like protein [Pseudonocardiaceae bacterium]
MSPGICAVVAGHSVPLARVGLREFTVPAPSPAVHHTAVRPDVRSDAVRGWLVGVSDGRIWGWWGPIDQAVAAQAPSLLSAAFPTLPTQVDPAIFARRLRRATRHAHTGMLALTVGSLELALWDLAGKRAGLPVWALLAPQAVRDTVPAYATCFGVDTTPSRVAAVMDEMADTYAMQKWRPQILEAELIDVTMDFLARRGPGRLAVDFFGTWHPDRVRVACRPLAGALAWVEEPYHPDEVETARAGEFGVPHAAGEHCYGTADAAQLRAGHVDVWQPDAVFCGGLVNLMLLVRSAAQAGASCAPHGGGLLPALHLAAIGEQIAVVELHLLLEPRRCAHLAEPPTTDLDGTGALHIPTAPGWCGDLRTDLADA